MSDPYLDKKMVYLAYRDIFKDKLAKMRKRKKVRSVVEKHKDHLHHKQLADSMDSEKICRILCDLLAARLFESESAAKATFPTLFSPRELGNDTALTVKCVEDCEYGQRDGTNPDAPPSLDIIHSPDTSMPNGASPESAPTVRQHRIGETSGRIRKPTQAMTKPTGAILQVGEGKEAVPKEVFYEDREKRKKALKRTRDCDIIPTSPTHLPFRLQHLILTQTQRLLEECCYNFAEKWFPSMLEANGWDAPEAVELTKWWKTLSKCDIPATAIALSHGQSLAVLFKRAIYIRNCAVHRRLQIPVKKVEEMVRDAWLLSQALQDDLRATQLLHWHKELENLAAHLQLTTNSQREEAEAELRSIHNARVEIEEWLVELESRESRLTQSLEVEGRTHRPIDVEALRPLEEALRRPTLAKALPVVARDRVWRWIENSVGMIINLKRAGAPKRLTVEVEPPGPGPRDQPLLRAPVLATNALHDSHDSSYGYMGERDSSYKRRKCSREAGETEQEAFQKSVQDSQVTTRSMTLRRTAVLGHESFGLTADMQIRAENETARHVRASAGQFQPWTQYPPDPASTDDNDKSTDYSSVPADYEWE
ncbi:uncharacterized protein PAC_13530 [Phialocephala subalpina]|uniref:Uncharacterized protein n=1 Tax=Phialocephala subalpina TaxID=576137 RepID=A0A1L7XF33_9HELO|nr:uncharacterized protein PAC_13530 [Phialocephala subalpina]